MENNKNEKKIFEEIKKFLKYKRIFKEYPMYKYGYFFKIPEEKKQEDLALLESFIEFSISNNIWIKVNTIKEKDKSHVMWHETTSLLSFYINEVEDKELFNFVKKFETQSSQ